MNMFVRMLIVIMAWSVAIAEAGTCPSGDAAALGSQAGFEKDKQAAVYNAEQERSSSDTLNKCVGGITAVITAPQFPSLAEIFDKIKNKVCQIASNEIYGAVAGVNSQIYGVTSGINGQIGNTGVEQVTGNIQVGGPVIQKTGDGSFWSNIWK